MRYLDTSVLLAYLLPESKSELAQEVMLQANGSMGISRWSEVEIYSALGVKLRMGHIDHLSAAAVITIFHEQVQPCLQSFPVAERELSRAVVLLSGWKTALKSGDALHFAIASSRAATVLTFDRSMAKAGKLLGLPTVLLGD
ncbi:type II toxin-antitoxin system VapC family toxin [Massilia sp. erpn]|uniref:type II toxin-antitoxin system VapC family toxin n=1 Tax=Massilia sp. erpn TaxID=2738142 RepID=UPI00210392B2|nr:type II toxin-antitoxin system VapC family toxin [Massilia sp. erpn]UTY60297.1 type II toxin-antitoxin system VapC family toxin [Massilia sp. erpn]